MIKKFLKSEKRSPFIFGLAAGLYPVIFYYATNYTLINSWKHLGFFIALFLVAPIVSLFVVDKLTKLRSLHRFQHYALPFLNVFLFLFFLHLCLYASVQVWISLGLLILAGIIAFFLNKHSKKIVVLQFILAVIAFVSLVPTVINQLSYSDEWMILPDDIAEAQFVTKPNVYYIQPDGYVNFSEIEKGYYNIDNTVFKAFLKTQGFTLYEDFRSNYNSTLVSNTAIFSMRHHYHNSGFNFSETIDGRDIIITKNAVLDVFKKNGYKTHFFAESPYLLANHPEIGYDVTNFSLDEISYIGTGLEVSKEIFDPLKEYIDVETEQPKFFFVEIFKPGHVPSQKADSKGAEAEKQLWIERLQLANEKLRKTVNIIKERDPNALILIMADHGGYVGMDYMMQMRTRTEDRDQLFSIFSSQLAIHWPDNKAPRFDNTFKTTVNTFRILFSYLAQEEKYLKHLEEDVSFLIVKEGAPKGVYKCIDAEGNIIFEKI
ncbi:sulfatase-like hydrolase/transferase [Constantimarinum furrinae]|uniref:Sulfatase N-terminal domain-containing protein n=1 Tax=Constantimarinum furrinae TaxID=2562285 RepID=A0A7G8PV56_9FLAO|nr:sulfatase-like hydrolase/transferase [Constantimarinum furrinae]QNJ98222.1 hypothetical protein ALE3EI_1670 [Constantimarinum furrinae]